VIIVTRLVLLAMMAVAGCGPVSQETAEKQCFERARLAQQPRGTVAVGGGSGGVKSEVEVEITTDFLLGRDPSQVYETCVFNKTGRMPDQPVYMRPGWRN
jgi:hypothetical protein